MYFFSAPVCFKLHYWNFSVCAHVLINPYVLFTSEKSSTVCESFDDHV